MQYVGGLAGCKRCKVWQKNQADKGRSSYLECRWDCVSQVPYHRCRTTPSLQKTVRGIWHQKESGAVAGGGGGATA